MLFFSVEIKQTKKTAQLVFATIYTHCKQSGQTALTFPMVSVGEIPHVFRAFYTTS